MPIQRLLKNTRLRPEQIEDLDRAFALALRALGLVDRNDPVCDLVARELISIGINGTREPKEIARVVVERYRE